MRLRNIPGSRETIAENEYVIREANATEGGKSLADGWAVKGRWSEVFGNDNPIRLEIGMGKGQFLMTLAAQNPDVNYVGIEKFSSVLIRALEKQDEAELANVRFIRMEAEYICDVFAEGEVDRIYLNFSDPWPKEKHAKRRLPSANFLSKYDKILTKDGQIEFKTDNRELFDFALSEAEGAGWTIFEKTFDLHSDARLMEGNIMTEYEEKFSWLGQPICKYIIGRPAEN